MCPDIEKDARRNLLAKEPKLKTANNLFFRTLPEPAFILCNSKTEYDPYNKRVILNYLDATNAHLDVLVHEYNHQCLDAETNLFSKYCNISLETYYATLLVEGLAVYAASSFETHLNNKAVKLSCLELRSIIEDLNERLRRLEKKTAITPLDLESLTSPYYLGYLMMNSITNSKTDVKKIIYSVDPVSAFVDNYNATATKWHQIERIGL
jgi:hypothetical protein